MKKPYELAELKITWFGKCDIVTASPSYNDNNNYQDENIDPDLEPEARKSPLEKLLR